MILSNQTSENNFLFIYTACQQIHNDSQFFFMRKSPLHAADECELIGKSLLACSVNEEKFTSTQLIDVVA